jgi:putative hydrolase of the HAD superfamily
VPGAELARAEALARNEVNRAVQAGGRVSQAWREYFRILLRHVAVPVPHHEEIIDALWSAHQQVGLWTAAAEGARDALAEVRRLGYRMGVVSNAEGQVARDLDRAGFAGMFETVVDSHLVGVEKPDPAIFAIAVERMRLDPGSTLFLGDLPSVDVAGAQAAGLSPMLLDRHDLYPEVEVPRLRTILDLPGWLARA